MKEIELKEDREDSKLYIDEKYIDSFLYFHYKSKDTDDEFIAIIKIIDNITFEVVKMIKNDMTLSKHLRLKIRLDNKFGFSTSDRVYELDKEKIKAYLI